MEKTLISGNFAAWGRFNYKKNHSIWKQPLVPGSFAAWGRLISRNLILLKKPLAPGGFAARAVCFFLQICSGESHFSGATSLPGAELFLGNQTSLNKPLSRQRRCRGEIFSQISDCFFEQATRLGQLRCLGQNCFSKIRFFLTSHLSRAAALPGAELFLKNQTLF